MRLDAPRVSHAGTAALLFEAPGAFDLAVQARIWQMAEAAARWQAVAEVVPGVTNLMLVFARSPEDPAPLVRQLLAAWEASADAPIPPGRLVEVDVRYGGAHGPDLASVAAHTGLSPAEIVRRHSGAEYRVFALGSQPGFAYLGGLDPGLATPRKAVPVLEVAAGTVVIGGNQTAIVAAAGPNGWHAIGHAAIALFDPARDSPATLVPGDRVRFVAASAEL